jgi:hypothetical protein
MLCCMPLAALAEPAITYLSSDATVKEGSAHALRVEVAGFVAPAYQWYFNGKEISGATGATHTISKFAKGNAGDYTVRIREDYDRHFAVKIPPDGSATPDEDWRMGTDVYVRVRGGEISSDVVHLSYKSGAATGDDDEDAVPTTGDDGTQIAMVLAIMAASAGGFVACLCGYSAVSREGKRLTA